MSDTADTTQDEEAQAPEAEKLAPYDERVPVGLPGSEPQPIPSWPDDDHMARRKD
jgi:hypothetical protein